MAIVEYVNDPQDQPRSYHPKTIPSFITDGGYWMNPDDETMIGVGDGDVPDTMVVRTLEELQVRQRAIHAKYPMKKYDYSIVDPSQRDDMTDDEINNAVQEWVDARS